IPWKIVLSEGGLTIFGTTSLMQPPSETSSYLGPKQLPTWNRFHFDTEGSACASSANTPTKDSLNVAAKSLDAMFLTYRLRSGCTTGFLSAKRFIVSGPELSTAG